MTKRVILTIVGLAMLIGVIAGIKILQIIRITESSAELVAPTEIVTTAIVQAQSWESLLTAVGSLEADQGIMVAAELPGKVVQVVFESGARVKKGDLLVRQNTVYERAQLSGAKAKVELAKLNLNRIFKLFKQQIISKSELDAAQANLRQANAEVDSIRAAIAKKIIRAPFSGRLGIRQIGLGQLLREGDEIVSLQAFGPILVNFFLPQRQIAQITTGTRVWVTTDAHQNTVIEGSITAINPEIDVATRNIQIQATVPNSDEQLRPGMYVNVAVVLPAQQNVLTIPATAALYAPYSDSVFVVENNVTVESDVVTAERNASKTVRVSRKILRHQFVRLGERRGDYIAVISGLQESETVVSSGVFKLRNGQAVIVDNTLSPDFKLDPKPKNK